VRWQEESLRALPSWDGSKRMGCTEEWEFAENAAAEPLAQRRNLQQADA
jgi:hypothetical protein